MGYIRPILLGMFIFTLNAFSCAMGQLPMGNSAPIDKRLYEKNFTDLKDIKIFISSPQKNIQHAYIPRGKGGGSGLIQYAIENESYKWNLRKHGFPPESLPLKDGESFSQINLLGLGDKIASIIAGGFENPGAFDTKEIVILRNGEKIGQKGLDKFSRRRNKDSADGVMLLNLTLLQGLDGLRTWLKAEITIWDIPTKVKEGRRVTIGLSLRKEYLKQTFMVMMDARHYEGLQQNGRIISKAYEEVGVLLSQKMVYILNKYIGQGELFEREFSPKELVVAGVRKSDKDISELEKRKQTAKESRRAKGRAHLSIKRLLKKDKYVQNAELLYREGYNSVIAYVAEDFADGLILRSRDKNTFYYFLSKPDRILKGSEVKKLGYEDFPKI